MRKRFLQVFLLLACSVTIAETESNQILRYQLSLEQQKKLNQAVRESVAQSRALETDVVKKLRVLESSIGRHTYEVYGLKLKALQHQSEHESLQVALAEIKEDIFLQKQILLEQLRFAYLAGGPNVAQVLFGGKAFAHRNQVSAWYQYLTARKSEALLTLKQRLERQQALVGHFSEKQKALKDNQRQYQLAQSELQQTLLLRQQNLSHLRKQLFADTKRLAIGEEEQAALAKILTRLQASLHKTQIVPVDLTAFSAQKGSLSHPVSYRHVAPVKGGKGLIFKAKEGSSVQAVGEGRVVFSGWLRGYGLLSIVDHGDSYMSLYGRNKALYKERGEWVRAGEPIAQVGDTGGLAGDGLFFELRHRGKSVSASNWFKQG